ncbi:MAG: hypothetical protein WBG95_15690 [Sulfitobacter sp.]
MKQIIALPFVALLLVTPVHAQDEPSLMERGAQLFFEGLMQEMAPAMEDLRTLMEEAGPSLQQFMLEMGPKLRAVLEDVEDWSVYEAPEVLENGDIIIRRKPDVPEPEAEQAPEEPAPQIDL